MVEASEDGVRLPDARLLGATFLDGGLPAQDEWMARYFPEEPQRAFLSYYLQLRGLLADPGFRGKAGHKRLHACFTDHTGVPCSERWLYKMLQRLEALEEAMAAASRDCDVEACAAIRGGSWAAPTG